MLASVDDDRGVIVFRLSGMICVTDLRRVMDEQLGRDAWTRPALIDTSQATGINVTYGVVPAVISHFATKQHGQPTRGPLAIAAPRDDVFGSCRIYQSMVDGVVPLRLFVARSYADAHAWLQDT